VTQKFEGLKRIFAEAGASAADYSDLEKLYAIERKQAVESAASSMTSTLKLLMQDLTTGNDAFSLKDRLASATSTYDPLAQRVAAGDKSVDYDDFADAARNVLDVQRLLSGSQDDYFQKLAEITNLTAKALSDQENVVSLANANSTPFDVRAPVTSPGANGNGAVVAGLDNIYGVLSGQLSNLNLTLAKVERNTAPTAMVARVARYGF